MKNNEASSVPSPLSNLNSEKIREELRKNSNNPDKEIHPSERIDAMNVLFDVWFQMKNHGKGE